MIVFCYVLVNSAGSYGENGIRRLAKAAKENGICVRESFHITNNHHVRGLVEGFISKFSQEKFPVPVVLFCNNEDTRRILSAVKELNAAGKFQFVASDYWGTRLEPVDGFEEVANGSITVTMAYKVVPGFLKYLRFLSSTFVYSLLSTNLLLLLLLLLLLCSRRNFCFRKQSMSYVTVDAISNNSVLSFSLRTQRWQKYNYY